MRIRIWVLFTFTHEFVYEHVVVSVVAISVISFDLAYR